MSAASLCYTLTVLSVFFYSVWGISCNLVRLSLASGKWFYSDFVVVVVVVVVVFFVSQLCQPALSLCCASLWFPFHEATRTERDKRQLEENVRCSSFTVFKGITAVEMIRQRMHRQEHTVRWSAALILLTHISGG